MPTELNYKVYTLYSLPWSHSANISISGQEASQSAAIIRAFTPSSGFNEYVPCSTPHVDLIWAVNTLHQCSSINITFIYVPGQQEALSQFEDLTPLARLMYGWTDWLNKSFITWQTFPIYPAHQTHSLGRFGWHLLITRKLMLTPDLQSLTPWAGNKP